MIRPSGSAAAAATARICGLSSSANHEKSLSALLVDVPRMCRPPTYIFSNASMVRNTRAVSCVCTSTVLNTRDKIPAPFSRLKRLRWTKRLPVLLGQTAPLVGRPRCAKRAFVHPTFRYSRLLAMCRAVPIRVGVHSQPSTYW